MSSARASINPFELLAEPEPAPTVKKEQAKPSSAKTAVGHEKKNGTESLQSTSKATTQRGNRQNDGARKTNGAESAALNNSLNFLSKPSSNVRPANNRPHAQRTEDFDKHPRRKAGGFANTEKRERTSIGSKIDRQEVKELEEQAAQAEHLVPVNESKIEEPVPAEPKPKSYQEYLNEQSATKRAPIQHSTARAANAAIDKSVPIADTAAFVRQETGPFFAQSISVSAQKRTTSTSQKIVLELSKMTVAETHTTKSHSEPRPKEEAKRTFKSGDKKASFK